MGHVADIFTSPVLATLPGEAGHRPHALLHRRRYRAAQRAAVFGGLQQGAHRGGAQRQHHQRGANCAPSLERRGVHLPGLQRHRSDSAPGGALLRAHPGRRAARCAAATGRRVFAGISGRRTASSWRAIRTASARWPWARWKFPGGRKCYVFASETCAFDLIGAVYLHDVEPGEMVIVGPEGMTRERYAPEQPRAQCVFEHVYFSRPDSIVFGRAGGGIARESGPPAGARMPRRCRPGGAGARFRRGGGHRLRRRIAGCPSARRSSATITWAARSSSLRRPSAISASS